MMLELDPSEEAKIVETATAAFRELGYRATSLDVVSKRAGLSKSTVQRYFKSKESLFKAAIRTFVDRFHALHPTPEPVGNIRSVLVRFGKNMTAGLMTPEKVAWDRMIVQTAERFPRLARDYWEVGPRHGEERMAEFLAAQTDEAYAFPDPAFSSTMFHGMLLGMRYMQNLYSPNPSPPSQRDVERIVEAFLKAHAV